MQLQHFCQTHFLTLRPAYLAQTTIATFKVVTYITLPPPPFSCLFWISASHLDHVYMIDCIDLLPYKWLDFCIFACAVESVYLMKSVVSIYGCCCLRLIPKLEHRGFFVWFLVCILVFFPTFYKTSQFFFKFYKQGCTVKYIECLLPESEISSQYGESNS